MPSSTCRIMRMRRSDHSAIVRLRVLATFVLPAESEIPKFVIRKDLRERPVGEPLLCVDATEIAYLSPAQTVEECVRMLLSKEEICLGWTARRQIMNGARLVGHIEIVDDRT